VVVRVRLDEAACQGHTMCAMTAPDVFGLRDEDGHALVLVDELSPEQEARARTAAAGCPEQAITLEP
jgi:ferredoxin